MPTQHKKTAPSPSSHKSSRTRKKEKKIAKKGSTLGSTSKDTNSGPDSSSEGNTRGRSRKKANSRSSQKQGEEIKSDVSSGNDRTSSSNNDNSNSSWLINACSASDGRSTSSSGENFAAVRSRSTSSMNLDKSCRKTQEKSPILTQNQKSESLRWTNEFQDPTLEAERLKLYKMNRRKRYLGFLQERVGGDTDKSYYA